MYIAILGRQPAIGIAELERLFIEVNWHSAHSAFFQTNHFSIENVGGTQKAGKIILDINRGDWRAVSQKIIHYYQKSLNQETAKITFGISVYDMDVSPREVQKTGLILKNKLKTNGVSVRLVPNVTIALSSATSHHNKLGLAPNKIELLVAKSPNGRIIVAESTGAQNITALAARDQGRPKRDAFVGMLPPKLAQIMINLTSLPSPVASMSPSGRLLDPFCGTGVILQEAKRLGMEVYGTDLSEKMIDFSRQNLEWFNEKYKMPSTDLLEQADAVKATWKKPIAGIASESYLGQPFSAIPSASKLQEVRGNCDYIITGFLKNIASQIPSETPLCIAVPAWKNANGDFTHLPLINKLETLGYEKIKFSSISPDQLLYFREDQIVARELLVLKRI